MARDVNLTNGDFDFQDNSDEVLTALNDKMSQALEAMAEKAETYAKGLCPVDTGRLRNSISHTISGAGAITRTYGDTTGRSFGQSIGSAADTEKTAFVGTNVEYAVYVETDDRKSHPNGQAHFLHDAVANHASEYSQIATSILKQ